MERQQKAVAQHGKAAKIDDRPLTCPRQPSLASAGPLRSMAWDRGSGRVKGKAVEGQGKAVEGQGKAVEGPRERWWKGQGKTVEGQGKAVEGSRKRTWKA